MHFFLLHLNTTNFLCVSSALLDHDLKVFILKFVHTSLQEDMMPYCDLIHTHTGLSAK